MAHAVESMFFVGETPWHGLGYRFAEPPSTVAEGLRMAGLDWEVELAPLYLGNHVDGLEAEKTEIITEATADATGRMSVLGEKVSHRAVIRKTDKSLLGVVGSKFVPLQNVDALATFQPFLDSGEASLECAGSLYDGKRVWALAKMNRPNAVVVEGDEIAKYIVLSHGHDGSLSIHYGLTPIRVVCANTEAMMRGSAGSQLLKIRHTSGAKDTLEEARELINVADARFEATVEQYRTLARKTLNSAAELERYFRIVCDLPEEKPKDEKLPAQKVKRLARLMELTETGHGAQLPGVRGTWWAAYNAVSQFLNYEYGRTPDARIDGIWLGDTANDNRAALLAALQMAA